MRRIAKVILLAVVFLTVVLANVGCESDALAKQARSSAANFLTGVLNVAITAGD